jgi:hypothetical protein
MKHGLSPLYKGGVISMKHMDYVPYIKKKTYSLKGGNHLMVL